MKRLSFIAAALLCFVTAVSAAIRPAQPGIGGGGSSSVNATNAARFAYGYRTGPVAISARTNVISYATQTVTSNFLYNGVGVFSNLTAGYYEISGGFNYYAVSNDTIKILIATNGVMADNLIAYSTYESTAGGGALGTNFVHISGMVYLPAVSAIASYIDYAESIAQTLNYQGAHLIIRPIDSASASATTGATGATGATGPAGGVSETNANQFGASTTLTLKDGVKLTNAVNEGITIFNGDSSNRANLIVKGAVNPKFRLTSVSPPQVLQLSSTEISTDAGGGQAYITISPEDYPTLRINTNSLESINPGYDLGTVAVPWGTLYASSFIGSGTGTPVLQLFATNNNAVVMGIANSNSVMITNLVGQLHKANAVYIELDCNHGNDFHITNRIAQNTIVNWLNPAQGQTLSLRLHGAVSGGTDYFVTNTFPTSWLVANQSSNSAPMAVQLPVSVLDGTGAELNIRPYRLFTGSTNIAGAIINTYTE